MSVLAAQFPGQGSQHVGMGAELAEAYPAARWALTFEWPFVPDQISFFHRDEGYPNLKDTGDIYIITQTGFQFSKACPLRQQQLPYLE